MATADGTRLMVDRWTARGPADPSGPVPPGILLVHGLSSNARLWDGVADQLCRAGHAVAAVDLRGHGRSDKPDHGYGTGTVAEDLVAVLDALADGDDPAGAASGDKPAAHRRPWARSVVVGQSWGGNVVVELGWRHPGRVLGVVCVDGGVIELADRFPTRQEARRALAPPPLAGTPVAFMARIVRVAHRDWPEAAVAATLANFETRADWTVAPWLTRERHLQVLDGLWEHRPSERWSSMAVPVLFLMADDGRHSPWTRDKRADVARAVDSAPRASAQWFVPADHDVHAQFPEQVAAAIRSAALAWAADGGVPS